MQLVLVFLSSFQLNGHTTDLKARTALYQLRNEPLEKVTERTKLYGRKMPHFFPFSNFRKLVTTASQIFGR